MYALAKQRGELTCIGFIAHPRRAYVIYIEVHNTPFKLQGLHIPAKVRVSPTTQQQITTIAVQLKLALEAASAGLSCLVNNGPRQWGKWMPQRLIGVSL